MKACAGFIIVATLAVYVCGEICTINTDCVATSCLTGSHVICEHPAGSDGVVPNGGLCTCAQNNLECVNRDDCLGDNAPHLTCRDERKHCYDNKCICTRFNPFD